MKKNLVLDSLPLTNANTLFFSLVLSLNPPIHRRDETALSMATICSRTLSITVPFVCPVVLDTKMILLQRSQQLIVRFEAALPHHLLLIRVIIVVHCLHPLDKIIYRSVALPPHPCFPRCKAPQVVDVEIWRLRKLGHSFDILSTLLPLLFGLNFVACFNFARLIGGLVETVSQINHHFRPFSVECAGSEKVGISENRKRLYTLFSQ